MEKTFEQFTEDVKEYKVELEKSKKAIHDFYDSHELKDSIENRTYKIKNLSLDQAEELQKLLQAERARLITLQQNLQTQEKLNIQKSIDEISNYVPAKNILKKNTPEKWVAELWKKYHDTKSYRAYSTSSISSIVDKPLYEVGEYIKKRKEIESIKNNRDLKIKQSEWALSFIKQSADLQIPDSILNAITDEERIRIACLQLESKFLIENEIDPHFECYCDAVYNNARHQHSATSYWELDKFIACEVVSTC